MVYSAPYSDEEVLVAALRSAPRSWERLAKRFTPYLNGIIRRRAGDLPEDLWKDVRQEVWFAIACRPPHDFTPGLSSARRYIAGFIGNALTTVLSQYRPPGERSRARRRRRTPEQKRLPKPEALGNVEELPDPAAEREQRRVEAMIDLQGLKAKLSPRAGNALYHAHAYQVSLAQSAKTAGISWVEFRRELRALKRQLQAA
jgi:DNA-directed RNA polymerase specialized sigma24 family protein